MQSFSYKVVGQIFSHMKRGKADFDKEFTSEQNKFFVLHEMKGYEHGDTLTKFISARCEKEELKDRFHAIW